MNNEKQRIAIAEACPSLVMVGPYSPTTFFYRRGLNIEEFDPLNDLNAMHEVEKSLVPSAEFTLSRYMFELSKIVLPAGIKRSGLISEYIFHATAAQRAEAFLRTIGKWED